MTEPAPSPAARLRVVEGETYAKWESVYADNVPTCFSRVMAAMTHSGFSGIKQNALEVAGSKGGAYASVTCIGTTPRATAVVMVVGGNQSETIQVRDDLFNKVIKTQGF